jgi:hypothetical protein
MIAIFRPFSLKSTLGDGEKLNSSSINFYGTLTIYASDPKKVDHILFWNEQAKVAVFEVPTEITTTVQSDREQEIVLKSNPADSGASATIELKDLSLLHCPTPNMIFTYQKETSHSKTEFILMEISFMDHTKRTYFVEKMSKMHCREITQNNGNGIKLEVPIKAIQSLQIDGHWITDVTAQKCDK